MISDPTLRIAADHGAGAFRVSFMREADQEISEFLTVQQTNGDDHVCLLVAPLYARPGGTLYLPAGKVSWHCHFLNSPYGWPHVTSTIYVKDHPLFREEEWPGLLRACAHQVSRLNRVGRWQPVSF